MNDLRYVFPTQIMRGALLRPDGIAVGLVGGGAPAWDLLSLAARAQTGAEYHRLLLALDAPIDVYLVDQPPEVSGAISTLLDRQACVDHPMLGTVLSEIADYLADLAQQSSSRSKQAIWAVTTGTQNSAVGAGGMELPRRIWRRSRTGDGPAHAAQLALAQAVERARRLADALSHLGGTPAPRLLEAEEIARLIYQLADPIRAQRYPLAGSLLDRVRRVLTIGTTNPRSLS
jgi:hypothetical protein